MDLQNQTEEVSFLTETSQNFKENWRSRKVNIKQKTEQIENNIKDINELSNNLSERLFLSKSSADSPTGINRQDDTPRPGGDYREEKKEERSYYCKIKNYDNENFQNFPDGQNDYEKGTLVRSTCRNFEFKNSREEEFLQEDLKSFEKFAVPSVPQNSMHETFQTTCMIIENKGLQGQKQNQEQKQRLQRHNQVKSQKSRKFIEFPLNGPENSKNSENSPSSKLTDFESDMTGDSDTLNDKNSLNTTNILQKIYKRMVKYREEANNYKARYDNLLKKQIERDLKYRKLLDEYKKLKLDSINGQEFKGGLGSKSVGQNFYQSSTPRPVENPRLRF